MTPTEQASAACIRALDKIVLITSHEVYRPTWLQKILVELDEELERIRK